GDDLFVRAAGALDAWVAVKPDGAAPTAALRWGAAVEGSVAAGGAAAPGAVVVARKAAVGPCARLRLQYGADPDAKTFARAEGAFRAAGLDPRCVYEIEASFPGFAPATVAAGPFEPRTTRRGIAIALERGAAIVGHVVDREGRPVGGATLVAARLAAGDAGRSPLEGPQEAARALSDGGGAFRLADLAAGRYRLVAARRGFATARREGLVVEAGRPLDVGAVTLAAGATLDGIVTSRSGGPVEGAEVVVMPTDFREAALRRLRQDGAPDATSDAAGRFALRDLDAAARVERMVRREGYNTANLPGISPAGPQPLEIALAPASRVAGVVLDPDRKPLAGADVTALIERRVGGGASMVIGRYVQRIDTDAEGRFAFDDVAPGKVELTFAAPGMQRRKFAAMEVVEGKNLDGLEIAMERGAWLVGRVLGPDGAPAAGATVRPAGNDGSAARAFPRLETKTDAEGLYRLDNLQPGERDVEAAKEGTRRAVKRLALRAGENQLDLELGAGLEIDGVVEDEGGAPAPRAEVSVSAAASYLDDPLSAVADEAGRFRLAGLADGDYPLVARADGYAPSAPLTVHVQGRSVQGVELRVSAGGAVAGAVHGLAPDKIAAATIVAQPNGGGASSRTQPDAGGGYRLEHLRFGAYTITGQTPGDKVVDVAATISAEKPEAAADLDFGGGFALAGRVVDGDAGLPGFAIYADGPTTAFAAADADGRFKIEGLEAGRYSVVATRDADGLAFATPVDLSGDREVALRAPRGRIGGRVLDARSRRPIGGAVVSLPAPDDGTRGVRGPRLAATGEDGRFALANVPAGRWTLTARTEGYAPASASATIGEGGAADNVQILAEPETALTLEVALAAGGTPDRVTAALFDDAGTSVGGGSYSTGEGGAVAVSDAPRGRFEMLVVADGAATARLTVGVPGGPYAVALPPRCALTIDAPALEGRAASVTLIGEDGLPWRRLDASLRATSSFAMGGGRAQFSDVPPGRWTVRVTDDAGKTTEGVVQTTPSAPASLRL
ncbi:MAG: carboxypeptidase regulatory-like domain-containing protein, partial [Candidatus Polarisedimenticolia bacterium]